MTFDFLGLVGAGLLTFGSPCILPLVPLYLGLLAGASASELREGQRAGRLFVATLAFSAGLASVLVALGLVATSVGRLLADHRATFLQVGGLFVLLLGLKFLGVLRVPFLDRESRPLLARFGRGVGPVGAFFFGAAFALGWTPCVGPVLGAVLTYTASAASSPAMGALYLGAYATGLVLPLIATSLFAPVALRWLSKAQRHVRRVEVAAGVLLVGVGALMNMNKLDVLAFDPPAIASAAPATPATPSSVPEIATAGGAGSCDAPGPSGTCAVPETAGNSDGSAILANGPAMVEFVSSTCTICRRMAPVVAAAEHGCASEGVRVRRVDAGTPEGAAAARRLGVLGVPTFVFLDAGGREVARLVGEQPLAMLEQSLAVLSGRRCDGFRPLPGESSDG